MIAGWEARSTRTMTGRSRNDEVAGTKQRHVRSIHATIEDLNSLSTIPWQHRQGSGIANTMTLAADILPRTRSAVLCVEEELIVRRIAHNDCARRATSWSPNGIRTCTGDALRSLQDAVADWAKIERRVCNLVVGSIGCTVVAASNGICPEPDFVRAHPLSIADLCYGNHSGSLCVVCIGNIVDDIAPGDEVTTGLMSELLTVCGIALIGVVYVELVAVGQKEGLPYTRRTVICVWRTTGRYGGDILPRSTTQMSDRKLL